MFKDLRRRRQLLETEALLGLNQFKPFKTNLGSESETSQTSMDTSLIRARQQTTYGKGRTD